MLSPRRMIREQVVVQRIKVDGAGQRDVLFHVVPFSASCGLRFSAPADSAPER